MEQTNRGRVLALIRAAEASTERKLEAAPDFPILQSIHAQLAAMRADVERGTSPSPDVADRLLLGVYAVREFDASDPAYSTQLSRAEYYYKHPNLAAPDPA